MWRAAARVALQLGIGVQIGTRIDDLDVSETGSNKPMPVLFHRNGTGDAADIGHEILTDLGR